MTPPWYPRKGITKMPERAGLLGPINPFRPAFTKKA